MGAGRAAGGGAPRGIALEAAKRRSVDAADAVDDLEVVELDRWDCEIHHANS